MKFKKLEESFPSNHQTASPKDLEANEEVNSKFEQDEDREDPHDLNLEKRQITNYKLLNLVKKLIKYAALFAVFVICQILTQQYFEINQVCPYETDFDCYYRYLLCEGDCNPSKPLIKQGFDFVVEDRKNELLLETRLAGMITKLLILSAIYAMFLSVGLFKRGARILIVIVVINIAYLRNYRDGEAHGDYTKIIGNWLIILITRFSLILAGIVLLARLNYKGKRYSWTVYGCILFLFVSAGFGLAYQFSSSCSKWGKGLYGESIDNTVDCQFFQPTFCLHEFFGEAFDSHSWLMMNCQDRKPQWELMNKQYANVSKIGFPMMTNATKEDRMTQSVSDYVSTNMREVTEANEKDFEVVLHRTFDDKTGSFRDPAWIDINIQFNQELVAKRSELVSDSIADNVLVVYVDSLSRAGAHRRLPETMKVFENIEPKVHEFFKYHSITQATLGNLYPIFYGMNQPTQQDSPPTSDMQSFIHEYKNKGFITGRALSGCATSAISDPKYIDEEPFDHLGNGWACDVNAKGDKIEEFTPGPVSMLRRCVYGQDVSKYVIDYGRKFWKTYKNQKKFLWLDFLDFNDFTFSQGKYLDEHLSEFLGGVDLSDTMLMVVSGNGQNVFMNSFFNYFTSVEVEKAAPALFIKLPVSAEATYGENLKKNKQQIIQGFEINKMLKTIPNPSLVNETAFYPIPAKTSNCDFPVIGQQCNCIVTQYKV